MFTQRGAFTATLLSEMRDSIHDSLDAVAGAHGAPDVSDIMWGRPRGRKGPPKSGGGGNGGPRGSQYAEEDASQLGAKLSSIHHGINSGGSAAANEYNRRRAAQMEQYRGTPEPAVMTMGWRSEGVASRSESPTILGPLYHTNDSFRAGSAEPGVRDPFFPLSLVLNILFISHVRQ
jgi:hypothetical protein